MIRLPLSAPPAPWASSFAPCSKSGNSRSRRSSSSPPPARPAARSSSTGEKHKVEELKPEAFEGIDLAIGSTPDPVAKDFVPWAVERGCVVVDESGYWRMDPEGAAGDSGSESRGRAESPGHHRQPELLDHANGRGHEAAARRRPHPPRGRQHVPGDERRGRRRPARPRSTAAGRRSKTRQHKYETFAHPIAFNLIPQIGSPKHEGYTSEEMKMVYETHKILGDDTIRICPTCVRVPVSQLPQREHPGRDRAEDHGRRSPRAVRELPGHQGHRRPAERQVSEAERLRRRRRRVHRPHPRGPVVRQRPGVLVRERQPPQRRGHERGANRRAAGAHASGRVITVFHHRGTEDTEKTNAALLLCASVPLW